MQDATKVSVRIALSLLTALFIAHCGDSSVHIQAGNGVSPTAGSFAGFTDQGGAIAIQVGSIEAIAFDCDGTPVAETFSPPKQINADGTFDVSFTDAGRKFHVSGRFSDNNNVDGIIDDANNHCDTGFQATRQSGSVPTRTSSGGKTPVPTTTPVEGGPTETAGPGATVTPGGPTETPGPGATPTSTPGGGGASCPTQITFTGTSTNGVLDTGWTGQGHDSTVISDGTVTVSVTGCSGATPPCGVCSYTGPLPNATGQIQNRRCSTDSAIPCTANGDCSGGTCKFFFGTYLPLAAGGVSTCVENTFAGNTTGTANIDTGSSAGAASLTSRVFLGPLLNHPCPQCTGDTTANDGVKGGHCSAGAHSGATCDANGSSPNTAFGTTSLDCPPLAGGVVAALPIDLSNTTGTKARTLSAANPNCRAFGQTGQKCQCETCNNSAAAPCSSNADCGSGICGGKRCMGGTNDGKACTANSECPGVSSCGVPGQATAPNACDDGTCTSGACAAGPTDQFCSPVETFRQCTSNADCAAGTAGDTCSISKARPCFDSGNVGDVVSATGQAAPPTNHQSNPTLAALFCIGPTSSGGVNSAAGLPGLGRLQLQGHATDNGTP